MNISRRYLWPAAAILIGGVAAWVTQSTPKASMTVSTPAVMPMPAKAATPTGDVAKDVQGDRIQGKVLETISVPNYVYLRIASANSAAGKAGGEKSGSEVWAAVAAADVKVGETVTVTGAQRMENFASSTLKRSFEVIYFGALSGSEQDQAASKLPAGHPDIAGSATSHPPTGSGASPLAAVGTGAADPHGSPSSGGDQVPVGKVERAKGNLGHSVAEVINRRKSLAGQKIRVRGVVVKSTSGVLGKTFVHLRDGSGSEKSGDHDLTVTTEQVATVGSTTLFEGTVVTDKDFGAGYSYPVLVENAKTVTE